MRPPLVPEGERPDEGRRRPFGDTEASKRIDELQEETGRGRTH